MVRDHNTQEQPTSLKRLFWSQVTFILPFRKRQMIADVGESVTFNNTWCELCINVSGNLAGASLALPSLSLNSTPTCSHSISFSLLSLVQKTQPHIKVHRGATSDYSLG